MKTIRDSTLLLLASMLFTTVTIAAQNKDALKPDEAKAKQAYAIGVSAYIWGYPMVVGQKSRDAMTKNRTVRRCLVGIGDFAIHGVFDHPDG